MEPNIVRHDADGDVRMTLIEVERLKTLRDKCQQLLAALEELEDCASGLEADVDAGRNTERNAHDVRYACKKAREAIEKAKGYA